MPVGLSLIFFSEIRYVILISLLAPGVFLFGVYVAFKMTDRNMHMLEQVDEHREDIEIESACLIVGGGHESGIKGLCERFDNIELVK